jgi:hypothetical protein
MKPQEKNHTSIAIYLDTHKELKILCAKLGMRIGHAVEIAVQEWISSRKRQTNAIFKLKTKEWLREQSKEDLLDEIESLGG